MTARRILSDLSTDAQKREHDRKQSRLDYQQNMLIKCCNWTFRIFIFALVLSIIAFVAYVFKCPYISDKAIDLLINGWTYIITLLVGNILPKFGFKTPEQ